MNTLEKIKNLIFGVEVKFADLPLEDGSILRIDTDMLEVGSMAVLVDADGNETAPVAGDLILQDGTTVTLDELGTVVALENQPEVVVEDTVMEDVVVADTPVIDTPVIAEVIDQMTPEDVTPEDATIIADEIIALINEEVAKVETAMNAKFEELKTIMIEMATDSKKIDEEFQAFKKSPSGKTISQMEFTSEPEVASKLDQRIESIKNLRKNKN